MLATRKKETANEQEALRSERQQVTILADQQRPRLTEVTQALEQARAPDATSEELSRIDTRLAELQQQVAAGTEARDMSVVPVRAGNAVGLLSSIEPAGVILRRIVEEAEAILNKRPSEVLAR